MKEERGGLVTGAKLCECWPNKEECLNAESRRAELQKAEYKESIKDVNNLVKFLFDKDVHSENRDYEAAAAAKERAKELLNIDVD